MGAGLPQPVSITSNTFATLPCPRHLARVFLCRALPCVKLAAARAPWRMTRDPLAVARDLACLPRGARSAGLRSAIRWPWLAACDALPLPPCLRSAGRGAPAPLPAIRDPMAAIRWPWLACPCPLPAIRLPLACDPPAPCLRSAARPGAIRWPIQHRLMADQARSRTRDPRSRIRGPRVRGPYGN